MFKKIKLGFLLMFSVFVTSIFLGSIESNAQSISDNTEFYVAYPEPTTDSNSGYVSIMMKNNSNGKYVLNTYFWSFWSSSGIDDNPNGLMTMRVICSNNVVKFEPIYNGGYLDDYHWQFSVYDANECISFLRYGLYVNSQTSDLSHSYNASPQYTVVGCIYGGNVSYIKGFNSTSPVIHWSDSASGKELNSKLSELLSLMRDIGEDTFWILNDIENIYNQNITTQQKIDQLISLQNQILAEEKESNMWLEKIFNFLEEKDEKDKEAATQQGSSSTSQGMNAIDDKGGDFANSLGGLTNSMSYSGTQCAWEFPEVKIPAIPGVMNEAVLIQRQPIDFAQWVNAIPSDILLVVQSVCTIGLIVYCFKELYNTIAYVLTLRRDDNE